MSSDVSALIKVDKSLKHAIPCPSCERETIVVSLADDAVYRCSVCDFEFETEIDLRPFSQTLFTTTPLSTVH